MIGIDEMSIKKRHIYRIVVSDLETKTRHLVRRRGRTEADMDQFYAFLGKEKAAKIRLAVMDMWKPFRNSTQAHAPKRPILFDKFHVLRHLGEALDKIRKAEYARLTGDQAQVHQGPEIRSVLAQGKSDPRRQAEPEAAAQAPTSGSTRPICCANSSISFGHTVPKPGRESSSTTGKRNCAGSVSKPYEKFAAMIERHWDGIAAYCKPENKVALGFVEGLNNKIRVIQRRAYGLRDEEYLKLKILTTGLPEL